MLALANRQTVYPRNREDLRHIERGGTLIGIEVVRVLNRASLHAVPSRAPDIQALRLGIRDQVGEIAGERSVQRSLQRVIAAPADALVEIGGGNVGEGSS